MLFPWEPQQNNKKNDMYTQSILVIFPVGAENMDMKFEWPDIIIISTLPKRINAAPPYRRIPQAQLERSSPCS